MVRCYGNLYSQGRVNALEALDAIPQLHGASELKSKILFSIVVVGYRLLLILTSTYIFTDEKTYILLQHYFIKIKIELKKIYLIFTYRILFPKNYN